MGVETYIESFNQLKVNKRGEHESPHKPCMLRAVIGMAEAGVLDTNRIEFLPPLLDRYLEVFAVVRHESDHANPYFPFFHLQGEKFWHLQVIS